MRVVIRADASLTIGTGHVMRCLTLAEALRKQGNEVVFVCRRLPGNLIDFLRQAGFTTLGLPGHYSGEGSEAGTETLLPWKADIQAMSKALMAQHALDWLIVDHYGLDGEWENAARAFAPKIMAIDDLANRSHRVDLLLDQNISASPEAYAPWLHSPCKCLFGPRFALLREAFQGPPVRARGDVRRVLVNFGGFDAASQTYQAMKALKMFPGLAVDFVAGSANPAWDAMQALVVEYPDWHLHERSADFAALMAGADLFIGAGGGTAWERAAFGLPTICVAVAANQQSSAQLLAESGCHLYLGPSQDLTLETLQNAIGLLAGNAGLQKSFAYRSRQLVDGFGVQRVCIALSDTVMTLRSATIEDSELLLAGRNAESVRRFSFDRSPVNRESHQRWLTKRLLDTESLLLIGEAFDGPVGVVRYDREGEGVELSIYLFEGRVGLGYGKALLRCGEQFLRRHWPDVRLIHARVLADNAASLALFQKSGYSQADCHFQRVLNDD
ncbi:UDP-2,4-diacetamido-2,4,6-trideoxy-beta-L-altropyranose hydrolase [Pseudomonas sp. CDFA 602]|uniref:UDP-2,4-diacetamido-2,4, 6-trideoxy-beta-L-altropyranose hydrolase n=1 Tax=Pseudomonas californiensis TaxID=2829823 RepID=UPI001E3EC034|nr:UDP-2,4-diacetamido-2,4,6-trideoxy-beta-L-altropyranose hydrolase [Pseudomonas californiensis]MCD5992989.1 UDP-2,4-diacetamido-2,4,6-trideoxy-beta-L-altropyranose hydrolase [Pseudomonas californiensis]MCD5998366.1 UDP-2,4-diacetamido-2,4,6-trideoxy-beta-L-altropyranose hydrolase [Pseudomonas californiensis]